MKYVKLVLFFAFLLSSCAPATRIAPASVPTSTSTLTLISTATISPSPTVTYTPTPFPLPNGITFQIGEGKVAQNDIAEVSEALGIIHSYFVSSFGADPVLDHPFTVTLIGVGANNQALGDLKGQCCGHMYGGKRGLFFDVQHPIWLQGDVHIPENPYMHHLHNVAHEYTHDWQNAQGCFSNSGNPVPMRWWISEGMAEYLSAASLVNAGKLTWDQADKDWQVADARGAPYTAFPSLKTMEFDFQGWDYSFAYLAVEQLVKQSPKGVLSLRDMCQDVAKGMTFSKAFQDAFGQSVDAFYVDFPVYAQNTLGLSFSPTPTQKPSSDNSFCTDFSSSGDFQIECIGRSYVPNYDSEEYQFKLTDFDISNIRDDTPGFITSNCQLTWSISPPSTLIFDMKPTTSPIKCSVTVSPPGSEKTAQFTFEHTP